MRARREKTKRSIAKKKKKKKKKRNRRKRKKRKKRKKRRKRGGERDMEAERRKGRRKDQQPAGTPLLVEGEILLRRNQ